MKEPIIVVSSDETHLTEVSDTLQSEGFHAVIARSTDRLDALLHEQPSRVVILDVDSLPADSRSVREVKRKHPAIHLVVISARFFHPELKEAMASDIDVCLSKPTDRDELAYWLNGIFHERARSVNDPVHQCDT